MQIFNPLGTPIKTTKSGDGISTFSGTLIAGKGELLAIFGSASAGTHWLRIYDWDGVTGSKPTSLIEFVVKSTTAPNSINIAPITYKLGLYYELSDGNGDGDSTAVANGQVVVFVAQHKTSV